MADCRKQAGSYGEMHPDGTTANSMTPRKPEYNYLREVDYCSAAALMIPKALFHSVSGFDSRYAPAYYEDTDLGV